MLSLAEAALLTEEEMRILSVEEAKALAWTRKEQHEEDEEFDRQRRLQEENKSEKTVSRDEFQRLLSDQTRKVVKSHADITARSCLIPVAGGNITIRGVVHGVRNLKISGLSDLRVNTFVKVSFVEGSSATERDSLFFRAKREIHRTQVSSNSKIGAIEWSDGAFVHTIENIDEYDDPDVDSVDFGSLLFSLYDNNFGRRNEFVGHVHVPVAGLFSPVLSSPGLLSGWFPLQHRNSSDRSEFGDLNITLRVAAAKGQENLAMIASEVLQSSEKDEPLDENIATEDRGNLAMIDEEKVDQRLDEKLERRRLEIEKGLDGGETTFSEEKGQKRTKQRTSKSKKKKTSRSSRIAGTLVEEYTPDGKRSGRTRPLYPVEVRGPGISRRREESKRIERENLAAEKRRAHPSWAKSKTDFGSRSDQKDDRKGYSAPSARMRNIERARIDRDNRRQKKRLKEIAGKPKKKKREVSSDKAARLLASDKSVQKAAVDKAVRLAAVADVYRLKKRRVVLEEEIRTLSGRVSFLEKQAGRLERQLKKSKESNKSFGKGRRDQEKSAKRTQLMEGSAASLVTIRRKLTKAEKQLKEEQTQYVEAVAAFQDAQNERNRMIHLNVKLKEDLARAASRRAWCAAKRVHIEGEEWPPKDIDVQQRLDHEEMDNVIANILKLRIEAAEDEIEKMGEEEKEEIVLSDVNIAVERVQAEGLGLEDELEKLSAEKRRLEEEYSVLRKKDERGFLRNANRVLRQAALQSSTERARVAWELKGARGLKKKRRESNEEEEERQKAAKRIQSLIRGRDTETGAIHRKIQGAGNAKGPVASTSIKKFTGKKISFD